MRRTPFLLLVSLLFSLPSLPQSGVWGERGASRRFVVNGNILYAADGRGVSVYDVSAANRVSRIDVETTTAESNDLAIMGTDLVVATRFGVERFAIAEDGTLSRLSVNETIGNAERIAANAQYAAIFSGKMVTVLEREGDGIDVARRITLGDPITAIAFVGDH